MMVLERRDIQLSGSDQSSTFPNGCSFWGMDQIFPHAGTFLNLHILSICIISSLLLIDGVFDPDHSLRLR